MLQFLTIVGAVLLAMVVYSAIMFVFIQSKYYNKIIMKMCQKIYNVDDDL